MIGLDGDLGHLALIQIGHELAEDDVFFRGMRLHAEQIEQQDHEEADDNPEQQVFYARIHPLLPHPDPA